jgi:hypothetical protein
VNQTDTLEQENIRLKEKLFKVQEQIEWMDHEITSLREKNTELQRLFVNDFLSDGGESIVFSDHHTLGMFNLYVGLCVRGSIELMSGFYYYRGI